MKNKPHTSIRREGLVVTDATSRAATMYVSEKGKWYIDEKIKMFNV